MNDLALNIVLVVVFVLIGGVFAATEMALVTLRESQVNALAARGRRGQKVQTSLEIPTRSSPPSRSASRSPVSRRPRTARPRSRRR